MIIVVKVIHVITSILLIIVVLMQFGRGSEIGAVFGGTSTQTVFGSSAPTVLEKVTIVLAVIFMLTSGFLSYVAAKKQSVFDRVTPVEEKLKQEEQQQPGVFPEGNSQGVKGEESGQEK